MKALDRLLLYYCLLFSLILTLGAIFSGFAVSNLLVTALYLPVSLYFIYQLVRLSYLKKLRREYYLNHPGPPTPIHTKPPTFTSIPGQKQPLLFLTLGLYSLTLALILVKAITRHLPPIPFLSPIP